MSHLDPDIVAELTHEVLQLPVSQRVAYIDSRCAGDASLRDEVASLVHAVSSHAVIPPNFNAWSLLELNDEVEIPPMIGKYRIEGEIARGNMGVVLRATHEFSGLVVALKLIRETLVSRLAYERFMGEIAALRRLTHPGIMRILDADVVDIAGRRVPYIAMELVDGTDLRDHVAALALGPRERLELVAKVCDAIHHAHTRGVVHLDLKPGNIKVTEAGQPKVLDFGIAQARAGGLATRDGDAGRPAVAGTLGYMSPEQSANAADIDAPSDVYSLGVILFELLAGRLPHPVADPTDMVATQEWLRAVRFMPPPRLKTLVPSLGMDLDCVVARALSIDVASRYQSASELGADLRRCLAGDLVSARTYTRAEQFGRALLKHRWATTAAAGIALALSVGLGLAAWQQTKAERNAEKYRAVDQLVRRVIFPSSEEQPTNRVVLTEQTLSMIASQAHESLKAFPEMEAELRLSLSRGFGFHSLYVPALAEARRALDLYESSRSTDRDLEFQIVRELTEHLNSTHHPEEAVEVADHRLVPLLEKIDLADGERARVDRLIAEVYSGPRQAESLHLYRKCQAHFEQLEQWSDGDREEFARVLSRMSSLLGDMDRIDEAVATGRRAIETARPLKDINHAWYTASLQNLGGLMMRHAENAPRPEMFPEAESLLRESLNVKVKAGHGDNIETLATQHNLARCIFYQARRDRSLDRLAEAEGLWRKALATVEQTNQVSDIRYAVFIGGLGTLLVERARITGDNGPLDEAEGLARRSLSILVDYPAETRFIEIARKALEDSKSLRGKAPLSDEDGTP